MRKALSFICFIGLTSVPAQAQSVLQGRIMDRDSLPLAGVSIQNIHSKAVAVTNSEGFYSITANDRDTILFRALGYVTLALRTALVPRVLYLRSQAMDLHGVEIVQRSYLKDSLELREEYQKGFTFRRPKFGEVVKIIPLGIGININQLQKALSFKSNKQSDAFKKRLINYEQDKFIDQRFTRELVANLTGLDGDSLRYFMDHHRPSFEFAREASQYDLLLFIKQSAEQYRRDTAVISP